MRPSAKLARKINFLLMSLSLSAWLLIIFKSGDKLEIDVCRTIVPKGFDLNFITVESIMKLGGQWWAWSLMVLAMMSPKLILPLQQLAALSLKRLRFSNGILFVLGYLSSWSLASLPLLFLSSMIQRQELSAYLSASLVLIAALIWQCSPYKQYCLNQGHRHKIISAFGYQSGIDSYSYGLRHGIYCVGSGWLLMLFPMMVSAAHLPAMAAVTFIMFSEHLQNPRPVKWRFDLRLQLLTYLHDLLGKPLGVKIRKNF
jgi:predicted metal-binding membrane protein